MEGSKEDANILINKGRLTQKCTFGSKDQVQSETDMVHNLYKQTQDMAYYAIGNAHDNNNNANILTKEILFDPNF